VTRLRTIAAAVATIVVASLLSGCFLTPQAVPSRAPDTTGVSEALLPYYGQELDWSRCEGDRFDCTTVRAPRSWSDPSAGEVELAVIRQRATDDALGSLLVNPGGPGVSGYDFVRDAASSLVTEDVAAAYDVIGFDPRGVGRSEPVTCLDDAGMDDYLYGIPAGRRGSPEWEAALDEKAEAFADACAQNSGDLLAYISTRDAARDLDLLRAVLGDEQLNYLGYSWGTALGAQYAELFPERVGRLVLDGALDPSVPGSMVGAKQAIGFEATLRSFFEECARVEDCPYAGTVDDMMADLGALLARVDRSPVAGADGRRLGADALLTGIVATLYAPGTWSWLRVALAELEDGDATAIFAAADSYNMRVDGQYPDNSTEAFTAYNCMDYPDESEESEQAAEDLIRAQAPVTADYWLGADVCAFWPVEPKGVREPVRAEGAGPILVVGTTGDPATPYEWAVSLAEQLVSGVLVTRVGEGHTGYTEGNACVDRAVDAYLLEGTVPQSDVRCG
jgi:pimeloyl-ACP methyl ester carboxylesterase